MAFPRTALSILLAASSVLADTSSNVIVLGGDITASWSGWLGGSVTLDQCNSHCAKVNVALFTTCGAYQSIFGDQMRCCCSSTFAEEVRICSACCNKLSYTAYYTQLLQVGSACDTLEKNGNTTSAAHTLSYKTVIQATTLPGATATQTIFVVTTLDSPITTDESSDITTTSATASASSSTIQSTSTISSTASTSASMSSTSTSTSKTSSATSTVVVTTSATSTTINSPSTSTTTILVVATTKNALPTVSALSSAGRPRLYASPDILEILPICISIALAIIVTL